MPPKATTNSSAREWAAGELAQRLSLPQQDADPMAQYLTGLASAEELNTQLRDILGPSPATTEFAREFARRRFPASASASTTPTPASLLPAVGKSRSHLGGTSAAASSLSVQLDKRISLENLHVHANSNANKGKGAARSHSNLSVTVVSNSDSASAGSKKPKKKDSANKSNMSVTDVWSEAQIEKLKLKANRPPCTCEAVAHALLRNCIQCGRIVCVKEGPGPCLTCGHLIIPKQHEQLMKASRLAQAQGQQDDVDSALDSHLIEDDSPPLDAALQEARARKDRLLDYDRTSAHRTQVIDQVSDFQGPSAETADIQWLTPQEKIEAQRQQQLRAKRATELEEQQRRGVQVLTIDLKSHQISRRTLVDRDLDHQPKPVRDPLASSNRPSEVGGFAEGAGGGSGSGGGEADTRHVDWSPATVSMPAPDTTGRNQGTGYFANNPLLGTLGAPKFIEKRSDSDDDDADTDGGNAKSTKQAGTGKPRSKKTKPKLSKRS
ncbi:Activating signal cointegrator 1 [Dimargaris cristalligena]|nr:Activating signal cointegrator 1 [Dimargaris cristalligena]